MISALIARTPPEVRYRATQRFLADPRDTGTPNGTAQLLAPPETIMAHKTGLTGTVKRLTAATNDSGVIFLPGGGQLAVSVYVKARAAYDSWVNA